VDLATARRVGGRKNERASFDLSRTGGRPGLEAEYRGAGTVSPVLAGFGCALGQREVTRVSGRSKARNSERNKDASRLALPREEEPIDH